MAAAKNDILQGTLTLLVLKTLASNKRMHGYAITTHIQRVSADLLRVEEGLALPGAAPHGAAGLAEIRVGRHREEPRGALLLAHREGPQAARRRGGELGELTEGVGRVLRYV